MRLEQEGPVIQSLLEQFHTQKDFAIAVPLDCWNKLRADAAVFTLALGAIASISLVVGGVGIMNVILPRDNFLKPFEHGGRASRQFR